MRLPRLLLMKPEGMCNEISPHTARSLAELVRAAFPQRPIIYQYVYLGP